MKKWIALLLAAVLCLSLSACGEKTSPEEEMLMTPATIDPPAKIETKPVNETIEITMDNWQDYFEEYDEDVWELDAFQELDKLTNCAYLVLKDEYASRLVEEKSSVTFEIKCFLDEYHITADVENRTWQRVRQGGRDPQPRHGGEKLLFALQAQRAGCLRCRCI